MDDPTTIQHDRCPAPKRSHAGAAAQDHEACCQEGRDAGWVWAIDHATRHELRRMAAIENAPTRWEALRRNLKSIDECCGSRRWPSWLDKRVVRVIAREGALVEAFCRGFIEVAMSVCHRAGRAI